jgi:hypothetical protein
MARVTAQHLDLYRSDCGLDMSGNLCMVYGCANTNAVGHTLVSLDILYSMSSEDVANSCMIGSSHMA